MEFKDQLRIAREDRGWSLEHVASLMRPKVSDQAVRYWEEGRYTPRPAKIKRLEEIFQMRFDVTGLGFKAETFRLPRGVTAEHLQLAMRLSRLAAPEREAITTLIDAATGRAERKPQPPVNEPRQVSDAPSRGRRDEARFGRRASDQRQGESRRGGRA